LPGRLTEAKGEMRHIALKLSAMYRFLSPFGDV
jgi:hypothetical protein